MWPNPQFSADLVTFAEEILNEKLHFLCSVCISNNFKRMWEILKKRFSKKRKKSKRKIREKEKKQKEKKG